MNVAGKSKKGMGSRDHHVILMIVRLHESLIKQSVSMHPPVVNLTWLSVLIHCIGL